MSQDFSSSTWFTFLSNCSNFSCWMSNIFIFFIFCVGVLILSLDKDTYEQLGLTGKPSAFQKKHRFSKYNITVREFMLVIALYKKLFCIHYHILHFYILFLFSYCVHSLKFLTYFVWQEMNVWWSSPLFARIIFGVDSKDWLSNIV